MRYLIRSRLLFWQNTAIYSWVFVDRVFVDRVFVDCQLVPSLRWRGLN